MIGFSRVRTHLGVVFDDTFGVFEVFGWIFGKIDQKRKIWAITEVLRSGEGPRSGEGSPCHSEAEREGWPDLGFATVHSMEMLCFCFVLFFRFSEDLSIGLIRTL